MNKVLNQNSFSAAIATAMADEDNMALTENGAVTHKSTNSKCLDFFSMAGASRANPGQAVHAFQLAFQEEPRLAAQTALWLRDVRGGAGEREVFRKILNHMEGSDAYTSYLERIANYIPEIGRFDDLLCFQTSAGKQRAYDILRTAIWNGNGLAAKWLPRKGKLVPEIRNAFGMTPKQYRKTIVGLTKVVEQKMCAQNWNDINYSHVPSVAAARYQAAFAKHDPQGYAKYRAELVKPEAERDPKVKINAGAIFPYDVLKSLDRGDAAVAEAQWNALPNFFGDQIRNVMPMVDTSASMTWTPCSGNLYPRDVAQSLGIYCADKNKGPLGGLLMTFSTEPEFVKLSGSLRDKVNQVKLASVAGSTNIQAAFDAVLALGRKFGVRKEDMPEMILIMSDMEFDQALSTHSYVGGKFTKMPPTNHNVIKQKYAESGYDLPKIVYWNIQSRGADNKPVKLDENGTALVSGFSPSLLKTLLGGDLSQFTPYNVMLETIDVERYKIFE